MKKDFRQEAIDYWNSGLRNPDALIDTICNASTLRDLEKIVKQNPAAVMFDTKDDGLKLRGISQQEIWKR